MRLSVAYFRWLLFGIYMHEHAPVESQSETHNEITEEEDPFIFAVPTTRNASCYVCRYQFQSGRVPSPRSTRLIGYTIRILDERIERCGGLVLFCARERTKKKAKTKMCCFPKVRCDR